MAKNYFLPKKIIFICLSFWMHSRLVYYLLVYYLSIFPSTYYLTHRLPWFCSSSKSMNLLGWGLKPMAVSNSFSCFLWKSCSWALLATSSCNSSSSLLEETSSSPPLEGTPPQKKFYLILYLTTTLFTFIVFCASYKASFVKWTVANRNVESNNSFQSKIYQGGKNSL